MENDAEGAVVGVGFKGVGVRHLDDGEESQQDEAKDRRRHSGTGGDEESFLHPSDGDLSPGAPGASILVELVQEDLHFKDTQIWTREGRVRLRSGVTEGRG
jgi:hypothetical protein